MTGRLDAHRVLDLFQELSDRLHARGEQATLFVVGGAAMALAYDQARFTRDVDALFVPAPIVREIAEEIGAARGLETPSATPLRKTALPSSSANTRRGSYCRDTGTSPRMSPTAQPAPEAHVSDTRTGMSATHSPNEPHSAWMNRPLTPQSAAPPDGAHDALRL